MLNGRRIGKVCPLLSNEVLSLLLNPKMGQFYANKTEAAKGWCALPESRVYGNGYTRESEKGHGGRMVELSPLVIRLVLRAKT